jgi:lipid-A-disaccharide synthase
MRYYVIAGEASGDLHSSNLVKELKKSDPSAEFRGWGGDMMEQQGVHLVKHYRDLAFMGFVEVLQHLPTILKNIEFCKQDITEYKPDVLVLVDYPGFNLRIAKFAKAAGFKVVFYISPQVWAWKASRVHTIKEVVDKMLVIFPFEAEFYAKYNYKVDFVGHPLLDVISEPSQNDRALFIKDNNLPDKPIIALLPGSRSQEIGNMLPVMTAVADNFPNYQFVIGGAPSSHKDWYRPFLGKNNISIVYDKTYALMHNASAALVTSGTATLETALWGVPEAICYRATGVTGNISYMLAKQLIGKKLKFIGIVNLIMEREVVKEYIQHALTPENLTTELKKLLEEGSYRTNMLQELKKVREKLGGPGASAKAASIILQFAKANKPV